MERNKRVDDLNNTIKRVVSRLAPPKEQTVSEWADNFRVLSPGNSSEPGKWKTKRTPYLKDIMDAFTDPQIKRLVLVSSSQTGKSEMILNIIGYVIDNDPGGILFIHPTVDVGKDFSKRRLAPMIRDCKQLHNKVSEVKAKTSGNAVLQKSYPGGMLTITGSNSAAALASTPARYVFGDERDRWAPSAGTEGDPWSLAEARTATFYNSKMVEVSTPTTKGSSNIEKSFYHGTQERWCHQCLECGEWHNIVFENIKFDYDTDMVNKKKAYRVKSVWWTCPSCGCTADEDTIRQQPVKWIAENPDAYKNGVRSFWLNAFSSPWMPWNEIILRFLQSKDDPERLKVVFNTLLGELWEDRGEIEDEDTLLVRRELYETEVPNGAFVLTCGVDTQDNRFEYEVVGHGHRGETWGIRRGVIWGRPDDPDTWNRLDDILTREYQHESGKKLLISATFIDSGGHYTQNVYEECRKRITRHVFAIKGKGGDGIPFTQPPNQVPIRENKKIKCWLYTIGVDAGKAAIMHAIGVKEPGARYCHFPKNEECNYNIDFFNGLLSERPKLAGQRWTWEKIPGHNRNEALDCRNYAMAAFRVLNVDMDAYERRLKGWAEPAKVKIHTAALPKKRKVFDDW